MLHVLNLHPEPFKAIKSGLKDIEMRLYDERRRNIKVDDEIEFVSRENGEKLYAKVIALHLFPSFNELYKAFPKSRLGYREDEIANPEDMGKYYSPQAREKYGVVGIEIKLIK